MAVYISSSCFPFKAISELLNYCVEHSLYNIELGCNLNYEKDVEFIIQKYTGFNFLIHSYFPAPEIPFVLNLASTDKDILDRSIEHCKKSIDLCEKMGVSFYSVHSGFLANLRPGDLGKKQTQYSLISESEGLDIFKNSIGIVLEYAISRGIDLLIENNVMSEFNLIDGGNKLFLMVQAGQILEFLNGFNSLHLGLLVDVGHLNVSATSLNFDKLYFIEKLAGHIKAFHLSENNGRVDQNLPFYGQEWFLEILKNERFKNLPKVLELNEKVSNEELLKSISIVESLKG